MPVLPWPSFGAGVPEPMPLLADIFADILNFATQDPEQLVCTLQCPQEDVKPDIAALPIPVPQTPAQIILPLRFRFARLKPVETDEGKPEAAAVANQAPMMLLPNLEAAPAPEPPGKQLEPAFIPPASPTVQAEAGTLRSGELAFAAKLTPASITEPQVIPAIAAKNTEPAPAQPQSPVHRALAPETVATLSAPAAAQLHHQAAEPEHKTETHEIPRPIEIPPEPATAKPTEGLRDISLRLVDGNVDGGKEQVEVRLLERAGELRVSVRSTDLQLNTELRNGLGDLAGKLEKTGFQTETWHPGNDSNQQQAPRQHPGQQHPERREPRSFRKTRPIWVEEMNRNFPIGDAAR